jgi:hypothetical protein
MDSSSFTPVQLSHETETVTPTKQPSVRILFEHLNGQSKGRRCESQPQIRPSAGSQQDGCAKLVSRNKLPKNDLASVYSRDSAKCNLPPSVALYGGGLTIPFPTLARLVFDEACLQHATRIPKLLSCSTAVCLCTLLWPDRALTVFSDRPMVGIPLTAKYVAARFEYNVAANVALSSSTV